MNTATASITTREGNTTTIIITVIVIVNVTTVAVDVAAAAVTVTGATAASSFGIRGDCREDRFSRKDGDGGGYSG
jgi:hypothetical protein